MQNMLFDPSAPKKTTNLNLNSDLLKQVQTLKINLSKVLEERLIELLRNARHQQWQTENKEAIETYNQRIERHGVFSISSGREDWRKFIGALSKSPNFNENPVLLQQTMRDEWD